MLTVKVIGDREGLYKNFYKFLKDEYLKQQCSQYFMPECVMLTALAKILAGKRCHFSWPWIKLSAPIPTNLHLLTIQALPKNKD